MSGQNKVSGVVLAGGLARRMQQQDKGLVLFKRHAMVSYPLAALAPLVDDLWISANRHLELYSQFGYPVISDANQQFDGPLAGILAAMQAARHPLLLVTPCDSPLVQTAHLQRLLSALSEDAEIAVAFDGQRLHPVFLALRTDLQDSLCAYLTAGERKLETWLQQHRWHKADFSDTPEIFANVNTFNELAVLEGRE